MQQERVVLCIKWGTLFAPDYVNVLYNACRRHLNGPFRFVCLTDDATGFLPGIEAFPIPDIGLQPDQWYTPGVWPKLALFEKSLHGLQGRALFIDLDMVILGGLDAFFDYPQPFVTTDMGPNWYPGHGAHPGEAGTCIFAFDLGAESQIVESFKADRAGVIARFRNEQDYVGATASSMAFWPPDWVISFKRWLRRPIGPDLFLPPKAPPATAKVLAFHGTPRPVDLLQPGRARWDRFPHMGRGQVGWMVDYWQTNGGRLPPFDARRT